MIYGRGPVPDFPTLIYNFILLYVVVVSVLVFYYCVAVQAAKMWFAALLKLWFSLRKISELLPSAFEVDIF